MPEATKPTSKKVGSVIEIKDGAQVTRPDGQTVHVSGTAYVLDGPGTYVVDGDEFAVKA